LSDDPRRSSWDFPTRRLEGEPALPKSARISFLNEGSILAGRFKIVRFIARGGMGDVYEAEDLELQGSLALKTIRPSVAKDAQLLARFKREVQLARRVTHPNVSRIYDVFHHREEGQEITFLTMELLAGDTLGQRIHTSTFGRLTPEQALPIAQQMAAGLDAAHRAGVVHRDFKSGNVMLVPEGNGLRVVVTDFGVARAHADAGAAAITGMAETVGSPAYMAPEQVRGAGVGPPADIYAFGVVLYEMVTGTWPFWGDNPIATAMKRLRETPPPPRQHVPDLPELWNDVILRCLAREPGRRYHSASAAVRALAGESTTAPGGPMMQALTGATRALARPVRLALAGVLLVLGVLVGVYVVPRFVKGSRPAGPQRRAVAVLGFKNTAGRPEAAWLSTALSEMLASELAAGGKLRAIPAEEVARARNELHLAETESFARDTLARLRGNLGADLVVVGSYVSLASGQLRLDVHLQDASRAESDTLVQALGSEAELFQLVSQAGSQLRAKLGLDEVSTTDAGRVRGALPADPRAAQLYAEGLSRLRVYDARKAQELLEKAVAADPKYPLSRSALSAAWSALGYDVKAAEEARRALELAKGLPRDERLAVEARAAEVTREWENAAAAWRLLAELYPDEPEYALRLAGAQQLGGKPEASLATVAALRARVPNRTDARLELAEARAAQGLADFRRALEAAGRAAAAAQGSGARLLLAEARLSEANALIRLGRLPEALKRCEEARLLFAEAGDLGSAARASNRAGVALSTTGDLDGARRRHEEALEVFRRIGSASGIASTVGHLAGIRLVRGEVAAAEALYREQLVMKREQGDRMGVASAFNNLAIVLNMKGDFAGAERSFGEALAVYREIGDRAAISGALNNIAVLKKQQGDRPAARTLYQESLQALEGIGDREDEALTQTNLGEMLVADGDLAGAARLGDAALASANAVGSKSLQGDTLSLQAELRFWQGNLAEARRLGDAALKLRDDLGEKQTASESRLFLSRLALEEGHPEQAEQLARQALEGLAGETADKESDAAARMRLAEALLARGKPADAAAALKQASPIDAGSRLVLELVKARVSRESGQKGEAARALETVSKSAAAAGLFTIQLEARTALARLSGDARALQAVAEEARQKGYLLLERRALSSR